MYILRANKNCIKIVDLLIGKWISLHSAAQGQISSLHSTFEGKMWESSLYWGRSTKWWIFDQFFAHGNLHKTGAGSQSGGYTKKLYLAKNWSKTHHFVDLPQYSENSHILPSKVLCKLEIHCVRKSTSSRAPLKHFFLFPIRSLEKKNIFLSST